MKSLKKVLCAVLTTVLLMSAVPVMASADITVIINGQQIAFDVPPQIINNRTMVPLRTIFEALGATVDWDGKTKTVTSTKGGTTVSLTIDNPVLYVNGNGVTLDTPACIVNNRTLVPVRAISEAFKADVKWDVGNKAVLITTANNTNSEDNQSTNPKLSREDIEITLKPGADAAIFVNKSSSPYSFSCISVNGGVIMDFYNYGVGDDVIVEPGETKFVNWSYDSLGNMEGKENGVNSYGYVVIEWNGKQYYADFTVNGIVSFYRGNVNGPVAENNEYNNNTSSKDNQSTNNSSPYYRLASQLMKKGEKDSGFYAIDDFYSNNFMTIALRTSENPYIAFGYIFEDGNVLSLLIYEDGNITVSFSDEEGEYFFLGEYESSSKIDFYIQKGSYQDTMDMLRAFYPLCDLSLDKYGIDVKISDFGIAY